MNLFCALSVLLVAITTPVCMGNVVYEQGIAVLTKNNFDKFVTDNPHVLVEFYTDWCVYCKPLAEEFKLLAKQLADNKQTMKLGKINCTKEATLCKTHGVTGYPTVNLYQGAKKTGYNGGARTAAAIYPWLIKKCSPVVQEVTSADSANKCIQNGNVVVAGFFKNKNCKEAKVFNTVANDVETVTFITTSNDAVIQALSGEDGKIVLFKKHDDKRVEFKGECTEANLRKFIKHESRAIFTYLDSSNDHDYLAGDEENLLILFVRPTDISKQKEDEIRSIAKNSKPDVWIVMVNVLDTTRQRLMNYFKVNAKSAPTALAVKMKQGRGTKYNPEFKEITAENCKNAADKFKNNQLKRHFASQPLKPDWNSTTVWEIVADNFEKIVMDPKKHVMVDFYAEWCGPCKTAAPEYLKGSAICKKNPDVVFVKIDADQNELEKPTINGFPTFKLYTKENKEGIDYKGARTAQAFTTFINQHCVD